ncbi:protein O-mannosyl-transferase TMTC3-like isoform X2 [Symsagittifera roscoffensis]|uniref:protein O-mannosyl-transferase TMTC3-like isoform X2 n=1 Tax=Symsagittifera roscoffensis TaxID=84072 RepID=UPI00307BAD47
MSCSHLVCSLLAFLAFVTSLWCGFVFDDSAAIIKNYDLRSSSAWTDLFFNDFWGTAMKSERSHKSYRPLTVLTFRLNYWLHELEPFGYHFANALLHSFATWAFFHFLVASKDLRNNHAQKGREKLAGQLWFEESVAVTAALLFAVHPVHVEAVAGVVGRAEMLAFISSLSALHFYTVYALSSHQKHIIKEFDVKTDKEKLTATGNLREQCCALVAFVVSLSCGMLCKETGITVVAVCSVLDLYFVCQKSAWELLDELMPLVVYRENIGDPGREKEKIPDSHFNANPTSIGTRTQKRLAEVSRSGQGRRGSTLIGGVGGWVWALIGRQVLLALILLSLLLLRLFLVQGGELPTFTAFDNPAAMSPSPTRELSLHYLLPVNCWLLLCPWWLCCDWSMGTIPLIDSPLDPRNGCTLLFWVAFVLVCRRCFSPSFSTSVPNSRHRTLLSAQTALAVALTVFPFVPASNLLFPVGFVVAERVLYSPSAGFCLLVALGFRQLLRHVQNSAFLSSSSSNNASSVNYPTVYVSKWWSRFVYGGLLLLLCSFFAKTAIRNHDWEDEFSLFISAVKRNKVNAKCWNNVGHSLEKDASGKDDKGRHRLWQALSFFHQAALVQPDDVGAIINVARTLRSLNETTEAEKWFYHAIDFIPTKQNIPDPTVDKRNGPSATRMNPNYLYAFISLANMIKEDPKRIEEADKLYQRAYTMRFDQVDAYTNRGELLIRQNRTLEAREMFLKARQFDEKSADIWYNLGVTYLLEGQLADAFPLFSRAVNLDPTHMRAKFNLAALLVDLPQPETVQKDANHNRAVHLLEQLWTEGEGSDPKVATKLATFYIEQRHDKIQAVKWYKRATELSPGDQAGVFNLALVLTELGEHTDALHYVEHALQLNSDYVKAWALKGDVLTKLGNRQEANQAFEKALQLNPSHLVSAHHLCVNKFNLHQPLVPREVLDCFEKYLPLAPPTHDMNKHYQWILSQIKPVSDTS